MRVVLAILLSGLAHWAFSQGNSIKQLEYFRQLDRLKTGTLIVCLSHDPGGKALVSSNDPDLTAGTEKSVALMKAVEASYSFSRVMFFIGDPNNADPSQCVTAELQAVNLERFAPPYFLLHEVSADPGNGYCRYEFQKGEEWIAKSGKDNGDGSSSLYEQRMASFNPENLDVGGLIIRPWGGPFTRKVTKKKRLAVNYIYKSRLNPYTPLRQRFSESIEYFQKDLESEYGAALKKWG